MTIESSLGSEVDNHLREEQEVYERQVGGQQLTQTEKNELHLFRNRVQLEVMNRLHRFQEGQTEEAYGAAIMAWSEGHDGKRFRDLFTDYYLDEHKRPRDFESLVSLIVKDFQH